jgi:hypothetical protein
LAVSADITATGTTEARALAALASHDAGRTPVLQERANSAAPLLKKEPECKTTAAAPFSGYQKTVVAMLAFLQFAVILDFMIMSPLGALIMPA